MKISIEKLNILIEKLNVSIEKANISIEKLNISIEKTNISIEKLLFLRRKVRKTLVLRTFLLLNDQRTLLLVRI